MKIQFYQQEELNAEQQQYQFKKNQQQKNLLKISISTTTLGSLSVS